MEHSYPTLTWFNVAIASCFLLVNGNGYIRSIESQVKQAITHCGSSVYCPTDDYGADSSRCIQGKTTGFSDALDLKLILTDPSIETVGMVFLSACETVYNKSKWMYNGVFPSAFLSTLFATSTVGIIGSKYAINQEPFWTPEYFIPTIGLLLGFTSGAMAVALHSCLNHMRVHMGQIETYLSMGATRWEAVQRIAKDSIRLAMLPTINQMSITGSIVIPGAMAGQIMLGISIKHAVMYQQIITFLISASTCLGVVMVVMLCLRRIVDNHHRIRHERIQKGTMDIGKDIIDSMVYLKNQLSSLTKKGNRRSFGKEDECRPLLQ
ncbi:hypothetical protein [Absidia glauca]|uniref:Uncharacterized protein n=1 Tax=Absidia glauca TaxID=4829 RepID=A0A168PR03_ABSGL|nr:hypothetical protein [Absidia glauca]